MLSIWQCIVGIIIGAAFGKIVASFVKDVIMPPLGVLMGGVDFSDLKYIIQNASEGVPEVAIKYGIFIQTVVDFMIVALAIFVMVKIMNKLKKKEEEAPKKAPEPSKEEVLLTEIRDLLKEK